MTEQILLTFEEAYQASQDSRPEMLKKMDKPGSMEIRRATITSNLRQILPAIGFDGSVGGALGIGETLGTFEEDEAILLKLPQQRWEQLFQVAAMSAAGISVRIVTK